MEVGRYKILDSIGTGATSRVARAHDPMIGRVVAIKLFSPQIAKGEARARQVAGRAQYRLVRALSGHSGG